jgi:hypothetical protein
MIHLYVEVLNQMFKIKMRFHNIMMIIHRSTATWKRMNIFKVFSFKFDSLQEWLSKRCAQI